MRVEPVSSPPILRIFRWIACLCLVWAAVLVAERLWFVSRAVHTSGTVVRYEEVPHMSGRHPTFRVVFTFRLPDGTAVQATGSARQNSVVADGNVGATLPVLYDPAHPQHAEPNAWMDLWFAPVLLSATAAFFWIFAAILAYAFRHDPAAASAAGRGNTEPA